MITCQQQWHGSTGVVVMFVPHVRDAVTAEELQERIHLQDVDSTVDFRSVFLSLKGSFILQSIL